MAKMAWNKKRRPGMGVLTRSLLIGAVLAAVFPLAALADDPLGPGTGSTTPEAAPAQAQLIERIKAEELAAILQKNGYRATIQTNNDQTYISTGMSGFSVDILLYDCTANGCGSFQFVMSGKTSAVDVKFANNWNNNWRYTKMAIGDNGVFYFTMDVNLAGGVTLSNILAEIDVFDNALGRLKQ
jgi:hypothetical protein